MKNDNVLLKLKVAEFLFSNDFMPNCHKVGLNKEKNLLEKEEKPEVQITKGKDGKVIYEQELVKEGIYFYQNVELALLSSFKYKNNSSGFFRLKNCGGVVKLSESEAIEHLRREM